MSRTRFLLPVLSGLCAALMPVMARAVVLVMPGMQHQEVRVEMSASNLDGWPKWIGLPVSRIHMPRIIRTIVVPISSDSSETMTKEIVEIAPRASGGTDGVLCNQSELRRGECPWLNPVSPRRQPDPSYIIR